MGSGQCPPDREAMEVLTKPPSTDAKQGLLERMRVAFSRKYFEENEDEVKEIVALRASMESEPVAYNEQLAAALSFDFMDELPKISTPT